MQTTDNEPKLTQTQAEVVIKLARNSLNAKATARAMFMHYNTVRYHISMIYRDTGKNPLDFYDLLALLPAAQEALGNDV